MEDLKPSSREEAVLAKIAGIEDPMVDAFEPSSREEWFMNKIAEAMAEGGGSGGGVVFVITKRKQSATKASQGAKITAFKVVLDKTYNEIVAAIEAGRICVIYYYDSENDSHNVEYVCAYMTRNVDHVIGSLAADSNHTYISDSADGVLEEHNS
jgi:hypothetical protein